MIKNLKDQIKEAQSANDEIRFTDLRNVYANMLAEKDRIKLEKKQVKSIIKQRRAAAS
jgi:hypothetical protein